MKIPNLLLKNFRGFQNLKVFFHPSLNVFVSENGGGKTTILEGINILLSRFATKLIQRDGKALAQKDIFIDGNNKLAEIAVVAIGLGGKDAFFGLSSAKHRDIQSKSKAENIGFEVGINSDLQPQIMGFDEYIKKLLESENSDQPYALPFFRFYGNNRVFLEEVERRTDFRKQFRRFEALEGAFGANTNFRTIYERFDYFERLENEAQKDQRNFDYQLPDLKVMREAITTMLPGFSNPRTKLKPLQFVIDQTLPSGETKTLRLSQLSDGFRTMLALVMDLSLRMAQANPFADTGVNPLEQEAVVIIDEIDLHLHPSWQQRILGDLRRTFPNTQFIVSTHSPQVLSTVPAECIRIIENGQVYTPSGTEGAESNRILKRIFGVDPRPQNIKATEELTEYLTLVYSDQWASARATVLRRELDKRYNGEEPALLEADLYIENKEWEQRQ
jgi:predicted ATP-binding protein involved in virulence